ncbi:MAG TPA: hypothetical protein VEH02_09790, partial [Pseudolabrys sp.]|nr:hypothetical protein [Pseudolabrys sp.]
RHLKFHEDRDNLAENTTGRTGVFAATRAAVPQRTLRTDAVVVSAADGRPRLAAFIIYATARAFWGSAYWVADYHYLTPFYSPCISASCEPGASHLGVWLGHFPAWIPLGMLVLPFLLAFRITCYYHRRAYYRSVWQAPPACAVPDAGRQRHPLCERHQMLARHRGELVSVPEGELAQEDSQRGGRIHLVEYPRGAAGAQHVDIVDAVCAAHDSCDDRRSACQPGSPLGLHPGRRRSTCSPISLERPFCSAKFQHRHQPSRRHQILLVKHRRPGGERIG